MKKVYVALGFVACAVFIGVVTLTNLGQRTFVAPYVLEALQGKDKLVHVAIIGGGVAGLSSAIYAARAGFHTVYFKNDELDSQLDSVTSLANWPGVGKKSGHDILQSLIEQAEHFGAHHADVSVKSVNFSEWPYALTLNNDEKVHAMTVIVATGALPKKLGIPGENEYLGKGIALCTKCDAPLTKDQKVIIVGSNDPAIEYAIQLSPYTHDITIMLREDVLQATAYKQRAFEDHPWVKVAYNKQIEEVQGDGTKVTGLKVRNVKNNTIEIVPTNWLFLAVGTKPNSELFCDVLETGENRYIKTKPYTQQTNVDGVFAAGTVCDSRYKQASVASGDGARAALDANAFLFGLDNRLIEESKKHLYIPQK